MTIGYTPKWKTDDSNVLIFAASNTLFDTYADAVNWKLDQFLFMIPFGLISAGILKFEHENGKFQIPHVEVKISLLGPGFVIEGPMFDKATFDARKFDARKNIHT